MSQSLSKILIHLVFSTKNREPIIRAEFENELHAYITGILRELESPLIEVGGVEDHVHILFNLSKKRALTEIVQEVKRGSSKWIKGQNQAAYDFYWQNGYGAFSVAQSNLDAVREYIRNQKEHHRKMAFQDEFRLLLKKYDVDFDERYVWD